MLHAAFPQQRIFAFDSFEGLPEEDHASSRLPNWRAGHLKPWGGGKTPELLIKRTGGPEVLTIVKGFYNESLTPGLAHQRRLGSRRAQFVDIDCDLHSSTATVLDWLLSERLLRPGGLVGYDDWWAIPCNHFRVSEHTKVLSPLEVGEGLAHAEMARKHGVRFKCVAGPCRMPPAFSACHVHNNWAPVFMVTAVGVPAGEATHGFELTRRDELMAWMDRNAVCSAIRDLRRR